MGKRIQENREKQGVNKMKIMTFNTQHCKNYKEGHIDFQIMADTILAFDTEIVGLKEMRGESADPEYQDQVKILSELTGMKYYYFAPAINRRGPYGNGFLSKIPLVSCENVQIPDPEPKIYPWYETRCILKATLENGITVLATHFGLNPDEQEMAVKVVLDNLKDEKCILMGDFNITPDNPLLTRINEKMQDTAIKFEAEKLSYPSDNPEIKIDYIFVSCDFKILSADIPSVVASDHRPHIASVELK